MLGPMRTFHGDWFWVAVISNGLVGSWGLVLAVMKRGPGRAFFTARTVAVAAVLVQVAAGVVLYARGDRAGNGLHVFYGVLVAITLTMAYLYRSQLSRRPALGYGLLLLFVMGLGLRAWTTVT